MHPRRFTILPGLQYTATPILMTPILTYYQIKKKVQELSGVIIMEDDMCPKSALLILGLHMGAWKLVPSVAQGGGILKFWLLAMEGRRLPQQKFCTIALGPIVQSMCRTIEGCKTHGLFLEDHGGHV